METRRAGAGESCAHVVLLPQVRRGRHALMAAAGESCQPI